MNENRMLTQQQQAAADRLAENIDLTDSRLALQYGASIQQKLAGISQAILESACDKEADDTGQALTNLSLRLQQRDGKENGVFGFIKRTFKKTAEIKTEIDAVCAALETYQVRLLKDAALLGKLYERNETLTNELLIYIAAAEKRLYLAPAAAIDSNCCELQALFKKRLYDLELAHMIACQMAPQIRMIQQSDMLLAEKIRLVLVSTIPLWRNRVSLACGAAQAQRAAQARTAAEAVANTALLCEVQEVKLLQADNLGAREQMREKLQGITAESAVRGGG